MADCPTGMLIDVCSEPTPPPAQKSKNTLSELLHELGVKYSIASDGRFVNTQTSINFNKTKLIRNPSSPSISEDDFITNEVFDFKVPAFDELDLLGCDQKKNSAASGEFYQTFEFPLLSMDVPSSNTDWNTEVSVEAKKLSKRLSMKPDLPLLAADSEASNKTVSRVDVGNRSYTMLKSLKSSDSDDSVFSSPPLKRNLTSKELKGKENSKYVASTPVFEPHPNPAEAMTPEDVRKIRGPLHRRGTFTLDKISSTPKATSKFATPGSHVSRRFGQDITQKTKLQVSTPKTVQRSQSLYRTPEVSSKISTFRKGQSPEVTQRRSSSLGRRPSLSDTNMSFTKPLQLLPPKVKVGGPSPLLRRALVPKVESKPMLVKCSNIVRGPVKATVPGVGRESQRSLSTSAASQNQRSRFLQTRSQS